MTNTEIIKKTLKYNRITFENVYKTIVSVQEEGIKTTGQALEKAAFIPEEGKKVVHQWLAASKEAGEKFRKSVLKGHEQIEKYLEIT